MCDGCGCDNPAAPVYKTPSARHKSEGWHVHADGTAHRHDHPHQHTHTTPSSIAKREALLPETEGDKEIFHHNVNYVIEVPKIDELFSPLLVVIPLQLLAYYVAKKFGYDIDQPRNLAKSVTVE